jgi:hypothetical protein
METRKSAMLGDTLNRILWIGVALGLLQSMTVHADDLFQMVWRGKAYAAGSQGQIVAHPFTEKDFITRVATDNGLDPRTLVFVYRPLKHDTAVVRASDGAFIADVIQMEYKYTDVSNSKGTATVRQAFLFDEAHDSALGSAFGSEIAPRNSNGDLTSFSFRGSFQYSMPDLNTVYAGTFATGRRIRDTSGG